MKSDVAIPSERVDSAGRYFTPEGAGPFRAITIPHGMGTVNDVTTAVERDGQIIIAPAGVSGVEQGQSHIVNLLKG
jgi:dienelactone hydrolase